jgi:cyanophycinase-like exopeptidase
MLLLFGVLILGLLMRRNKRRRAQQAIIEKTSSPHVKDGSLKGIVVTRVFETKTVGPEKIEMFDVRGRKDSFV